MITQLGQKLALALRVLAKKAPLFVVRRLFGKTKLLSLRLDWRFFSQNRDFEISIHKPWPGWIVFELLRVRIVAISFASLNSVFV